MKLRDRIEFIARGGKTRRYHTEDTLHQQNVGEHSWGVAMLVSLIDPQASKELILAALVHDLAEHVAGDVPAPVKRSYPAVKDAFNALEDDLLAGAGLGYAKGLNTSQLAVLKAADVIEGMLYCINERRRGNLDIKRVFNNFFSYVSAISGLPREGRELVLTVKEMWEDANESKR